MILEEELIKHKWKYIQEYDIWSKLGVSFRNVDRALGNFDIRYADRLSCNVSPSSIEDLEIDVKYGTEIIFSNKQFWTMFTTKQKRTLKNWIL